MGTPPAPGLGPSLAFRVRIPRGCRAYRVAAETATDSLFFFWFRDTIGGHGICRPVDLPGPEPRVAVRNPRLASRPRLVLVPWPPYSSKAS